MRQIPLPQRPRMLWAPHFPLSLVRVPDRLSPNQSNPSQAPETKFSDLNARIDEFDSSLAGFR
jgi:hypothetical protein